MKSFLWAMVFSIIGGVLGAFLALGFGASVGVSTGLIQGAQIAACLAVQAAGEQGLIADDRQGDALVAGTIAKVRAKAEAAPSRVETTWVADTAGCTDLLAKLEGGQAQPQTKLRP